MTLVGYIYERTTVGITVVLMNMSDVLDAERQLQHDFTFSLDIYGSFTIST